MLSAPMQSAHLPQHSPLRSRSVLPSLFRLAAASPQSRRVRIQPPFRKRKFRQSPQPQHPLRKKRPLRSSTRRIRPQHPCPLSANTRNPAKRSRLIFRQRTQPALSALRSTCRKAGRSEVTKVFMIIRLLPLIRDMTNTAAPCPDASCCLMKTAILPVQSDLVHPVPRGMRSMDTVRLSLTLLWDTSNTSTGIIIILWTVILQTARVCIPFRITEFHPLHG